MSTNIFNKFIDRFLSDLSNHMGENCEIVVHDFSNGYEHTVVKIYNGLVGRKVGDTPTNVFFEALQKEGPKLEDLGAAYYDMPDGRTFKCFTTFVRDEEGNAIGAICVNEDITDMVRAINTLGKRVGLKESQEKKVIYTHTLEELMEYYLVQVEQIIGKKADEMDKTEKLEALDYLDQKGVLHMAKASVRLCEFFCFSKFTLYNYLEEVRSRREQKEHFTFTEF